MFGAKYLPISCEISWRGRGPCAKSVNWMYTFFFIHLGRSWGLCQNSLATFFCDKVWHQKKHFRKWKSTKYKSDVFRMIKHCYTCMQNLIMSVHSWLFRKSFFRSWFASWIINIKTFVNMSLVSLTLTFLFSFPLVCTFLPSNLEHQSLVKCQEHATRWTGRAAPDPNGHCPVIFSGSDCKAGNCWQLRDKKGRRNSFLANMDTTVFANTTLQAFFLFVYDSDSRKIETD